MDNWTTNQKGGEKEIAKLIVCDICEQNTKEENSSELKLRNNDTKMSKIVDICAGCIKGKGILDLLGNIAWKSWDQTSRSWKIPQK